MDIKWLDRFWTFDWNKVGAEDAAEIKRRTGLLFPMSFVDAVQQADPEALQALMWLLRKQNGIEHEALSDCNYPLIEFLEAFTASSEDEAARQDPPVPEASSGDSPTMTSVSSVPAI